jgi:hypothetical protein
MIAAPSSRKRTRDRGPKAPRGAAQKRTYGDPEVDDVAAFCFDPLRCDMADTIPADVWELVFDHLPLLDVVKCSIMCHSWNNVVMHSYVLKKALMRPLLWNARYGNCDAVNRLLRSTYVTAALVAYDSNHTDAIPDIVAGGTPILTKEQLARHICNTVAEVPNRHAIAFTHGLDAVKLGVVTAAQHKECVAKLEKVNPQALAHMADLPLQGRTTVASAPPAGGRLRALDMTNDDCSDPDGALPENDADAMVCTDFEVLRTRRRTKPRDTASPFGNKCTLEVARAILGTVDHERKIYVCTAADVAAALLTGDVDLARLVLDSRSSWPHGEINTHLLSIAVDRDDPEMATLLLDSAHVADLAYLRNALISLVCDSPEARTLLLAMLSRSILQSRLNGDDATFDAAVLPVIHYAERRICFPWPKTWFDNAHYTAVASNHDVALHLIDMLKTHLCHSLIPLPKSSTNSLFIEYRKLCLWEPDSPTTSRNLVDTTDDYDVQVGHHSAPSQDDSEL